MSQDEVGLLDTSAVLLIERLPDPSLLPVHPLVSVVTLAELTVGPLVARSHEERAARLAQLQKVEVEFDPLPFDAAAARAFGPVAASLRQAGRKPTARSLDAMIAAIAIANGLPLYTANPRDFADIAHLTVVTVPHPDR